MSGISGISAHTARWTQYQNWIQDSLQIYVLCVVVKKKKESKFPTGTEYVSNNIDFISFGNPQEYLVLL